MKKAYFLTLSLLVILLTSSCKKCKVENITVNKGAIIEEANIYPESGYMTSSMAGDYEVNASHSYADNFQVSIDGGAKTNVDYSQFKILANPVSAKCNASYDRNVVINDTDQTVTYTINVEQCTICDYDVVTENYVLVPTFPDNYVVDFVVNIVDKD